MASNPERFTNLPRQGWRLPDGPPTRQVDYIDGQLTLPAFASAMGKPTNAELIQGAVETGRLSLAAAKVEITFLDDLATGANTRPVE